jgi:hypothetical protein
MKRSILLLTLVLFSSKIFAWGNSELFVSIADYGRYTVTLNGQYINDRDGRYEFYEVPSGRCELVISKGPFLLYRDWIIISAYSRTVVEYSSRFGLRIVDVINFRNQGSYGYNNGYGNNGNGYGNGHGRKKHHDRDYGNYGGSCEPRRDDRSDDRRDDNRGGYDNRGGNANRGGNDNRGGRGNDYRDGRFNPNNSSSLGNNTPFDNNDKKPVIIDNQGNREQ